MAARSERLAFHILIFITTTFAILSAMMFALMFCAQSMGVANQLLSQRIELRGAIAITDAEEEVKDILNGHAVQIAEETYAQTAGELLSESVSRSEDEALQMYLERYAQALSEVCRTGRLQEELSARLEVEKGTIRLDDTEEPEFEIITDEQTGAIQGCELKNVSFLYTYADRYEKRGMVDYRIDVPYGTFYDGNDQLFEYSLIGRKGIYFTGQTSSVVGNLFAGTHSAEEYRKAEASYGERGIYGGINLMATQLGIEADTVVSTGDINLKGSFAAFGTEEKPIRIYAGEINELAGFYMRTNYTLNGEAHQRNGLDYEEAVTLINKAEGKIGEFNYYYDTENDDTYTGQYRKILSNTDVSLAGDFTGTVMTSGNVIIEADCNVEGLIYAGDRIYVQGNNNIVSNRDIMRRIIEEESSREDADPTFQIREYLGGITYKGMAPCPEEMVAYVITK